MNTKKTSFSSWLIYTEINILPQSHFLALGARDSFLVACASLQPCRNQHTEAVWIPLYHNPEHSIPKASFISKAVWNYNHKLPRQNQYRSNSSFLNLFRFFFFLIPYRHIFHYKSILYTDPWGTTLQYLWLKRYSLVNYGKFAQEATERNKSDFQHIFP